MHKHMPKISDTPLHHTPENQQHWLTDHDKATNHCKEACKD